jgi:hypothetical protein
MHCSGYSDSNLKCPLGCVHVMSSCDLCKYFMQESLISPETLNS